MEDFLVETSKFTSEQIALDLKQAKLGTSAEIARKLSISCNTFLHPEEAVQLNTGTLIN